jgi:hypothetical protein
MELIRNVNKFSPLGFSKRNFFTFADLKKKGVIFIITNSIYRTMYWTLELAQHLEDAPWPATKDELIDFAIRSGAPMEVIENLQELEDEGDTNH